jgi:hypothetical protein
MATANSGSAGIHEPREINSKKEVRAMAGANTGSAGTGKPRRPKTKKKK